MGKLLMLKLIENLKRISTIQNLDAMPEEVIKLNHTIERLNSAKNIHLFRTDYLE